MADTNDLGPTLEQTAVVAGYVYAWLSHPAWNNFYEPELRRARDLANAYLLNPVEAMRGGYTDDYLRARINVIDEMLSMGQRFVNDYEAMRQKAAEEDPSQFEAGYDVRADLGRIAPLS